MTATEVLERSAEMSRLLGATYGRLQSELLTPLMMRAVAILRRRGEIPDIVVDGRTVELQYRSPWPRHRRNGMSRRRSAGWKWRAAWARRAKRWSITKPPPAGSPGLSACRPN